MKLEIELVEVESILLTKIFEDNRAELKESWGVENMAGFVKLLAMHGADYSNDFLSN